MLSFLPDYTFITDSTRTVPLKLPVFSTLGLIRQANYFVGISFFRFQNFPVTFYVHLVQLSVINSEPASVTTTFSQQFEYTLYENRFGIFKHIGNKRNNRNKRTNLMIYRKKKPNVASKAGYVQSGSLERECI